MPSMEVRYQQILDQISKAQTCSPNQKITLVAVTKTHPIETIAELYQLGHRDFGENYVQELLEKAQVLESKGYTGIRWHFIGHLQTNKVKALIPWVFSVHTVDSEKLAQELAKRWRTSGRSGRLPVFIEVNIDREASKTGLPPEETPNFTQTLSLIPELDLQGLMCIPSPASTENGRLAFRHLRELELQCRPWTHGNLSMGMSSDYLAAIQEGSTHIRLGTVLVGARGTH